jgi:UDP-N-acetylmuramate dehydrogenase
LVSDAGLHGVVILNRARRVRFVQNNELPTVWTESGTNFGTLARRAAERGFSGLEWAGGIPGTVGGAVVGNAGAHGHDMAGSLVLAEILHHIPQAGAMVESWPVEKLDYSYRSSILRSARSDLQSQLGGEAYPQVVVLSAVLRLEHSTPQAVGSRMDDLIAYRRRTQPPGASMGSMFKNPPGDYAGRLIEAAGLKGARIGDAEISPLHANFFINRGHATAADIRELID